MMNVPHLCWRKNTFTAHSSSSNWKYAPLCSNREQLANNIFIRHCRGWLQRDVAYLAWPIAPSYMSPNEGGGRGLQGLSQWEQLYTGVTINFGDLTPHCEKSHFVLASRQKIPVLRTGNPAVDTRTICLLPIEFFFKLPLPEKLRPENPGQKQQIRLEHPGLLVPEKVRPENSGK